MNKTLIAATALVAALALPAAAMAAIAQSPYSGPTPVPTGLDLNSLVSLVFDILWVVFGAFAVFMFVLAGFQFIVAQGDPDQIKKARDFLLWGAVGVFVAVIAFSIPFAIRTATGV